MFPSPVILMCYYLSQDILRFVMFVGECVCVFINVFWGRISRKPLEIGAGFQWTINRKWHMANRLVTWSTTLRDPLRMGGVARACRRLRSLTLESLTAFSSSYCVCPDVSIAYFRPGTVKCLKQTQAFGIGLRGWLHMHSIVSPLKIC